MAESQNAAVASMASIPSSAPRGAVFEGRSQGLLRARARPHGSQTIRNQTSFHTMIRSLSPRGNPGLRVFQCTPPQVHRLFVAKNGGRSWQDQNSTIKSTITSTKSAPMEKKFPIPGGPGCVPLCASSKSRRKTNETQPCFKGPPRI